MLTTILLLVLGVTPAECAANPEWCVCRRYIAVELNKCEVQAERFRTEEERQMATRLCHFRYKECALACETNDVNLCPDSPPTEDEDGRVSLR